MTELAHILVVDDDPSIRRMFQLLLDDTGYRVSTATTGEEALAYRELVTPDLVLMDLMLPGISGQDVTARIKADTDKPFIPVILVTAKSDQRAQVTALDAGADREKGAMRDGGDYAPDQQHLIAGGDSGHAPQ